MIRGASLPFLALLLVSLALTISAAEPPKGTSFDFEGIKYTFYPSQPARTWEQGKAFCNSQNQELAQFQKRSQVESISEYLSEQGGVWTAYFTDGDAIPQAINEAGPAPWNADLPMRSNGRPSYPEDRNKCGLLQVTKNDTGVVPTDCSTRKAALCCDVSGVKGIKSPNVSSFPSNITAPLAVKAGQSNISNLPGVLGTSSTGLTVNASSPISIPADKAVQTTVADISRANAAVASSPEEPMDEVTAAAAAVTAAKKRLAAAVANAANSASSKSPKAVEEPVAALPKAAQEAQEAAPASPKAAQVVEEAAPGLPKMAQEAAPALPKAAQDSAPVLPKVAEESGPAPTKTKRDLTPAPATKAPIAETSKAASRASPGAIAPSEKAEATKSSGVSSVDSSDPSVSFQYGSEDSLEELSKGEVDAGEVEHSGSKVLSLPDQAAPVKFTIMGTQFFYFKDVLHFGGWYQARAFCREHGMELATFLNRDQLMKVATRVSGDPVWTGYYTDGTGAMLSSDEEHAPWKIAFAMAGIPSNQPNMCGMLSVLLGKNVGVWPHACAAPRTTLCSIHNVPAKKRKHALKPATVPAAKAAAASASASAAVSAAAAVLPSNNSSAVQPDIANKNSTVVA